MPFFSINVSGWIVATSGMTNEEVGAFDRLLMVMAAAPDHSLPDDDAKLARVARCTPKRWQQELRADLEPKFIIRDGVWRHEWIEKEVAFIAEKQAKRRHAANVRWQSKPQENNEMANASASGVHVQTHMQNDATFTFTSPSQEESLSVPEREPAKAKRRKPQVPFPDDDAFRLRCQQIAAEIKPELDFETTFRRFRNHAIQNDRRAAVWIAAWSNWIDQEKPNHHGQSHQGQSHQGAGAKQAPFDAARAAGAAALRRRR